MRIDIDNSLVRDRLEDIDDDLAEIRAQLDKFEKLTSTKSQTTPFYATNLDAKTRKERAKYNLPELSVFDGIIDNCKLGNTVERIPGIHDSELFISSGFGTVFTAHEEDFGLAALNYLITGEPKIWFLIYEDDHEKFEELIKLLKLEPPSKTGEFCAQFIRHEELFVPEKVLAERGIRYKLVKQHAGQVVVAFPGCYHYGINTGPNIAEAINFSLDSWDPESYGPECTQNVCTRTEVLKKEHFRQKVTAEQEASHGIGSSTGNIEPQIQQNIGSSIGDIEPQAQQNNSSSTLVDNANGKRTRGNSTDDRAYNGTKPKKQKIDYSTAVNEWIKEWHDQQISKGIDLVIGDGKELTKTVLEQAQKKASSNMAIDPLNIIQLVLSFGSVDSFQVVRDAIVGMRTRIQWSNNQQLDRDFSIVRAIDELSLIDSTAASHYRILLVKLAPVIAARKNGIIEAIPENERGMKRGGPEAWSIGQAYIQLVKEAYPLLNEEEQKKKIATLQTQYVMAKKLQSLVHEFGAIIVLLMPKGGVFKVSNSIFRQMNKSEYEIFSHCLTHWRGDWLQEIYSRLNEYAAACLEGKLLTQEEFPVFPIERATDDEILAFREGSDELLGLLGPPEMGGDAESIVLSLLHDI